jgi:GntR family transcriptional regulator/MocR family aminotransferase
MRDLIRERLAGYAGEIDLRGDEGGLHVVVAGRARAFDLALREALGARGIVYNEVREFAGSAAAESGGLLMGYGHMDLGDLSAALDALTACIARCASR